MKRSSVTDEAIERAIAGGAKSLSIRMPGAEPTAGPFSLEFHVAGRPVPWSAPHTTRTGHAYKGKRLVAWQKLVKDSAAVAMRGRPPHAGPVEIELTFHMAPSRNGSCGDLSNLVKGTEDALQGVVIVNDRQVCKATMRRRKSAIDGARVKVTSIEEE